MTTQYDIDKIIELAKPYIKQAMKNHTHDQDSVIIPIPNRKLIWFHDEFDVNISDEDYEYKGLLNVTFHSPIISPRFIGPINQPERIVYFFPIIESVEEERDRYLSQRGKLNETQINYEDIPQIDQKHQYRNPFYTGE